MLLSDMVSLARVMTKEESSNGAHIRAPRPDLNERREIKITLPARLTVMLSTHKILTGKKISSTVEEALETYFSDRARREGDLLPEEVR